MKRGTQNAGQMQSATGAKPHGVATSAEIDIAAAQLPRNARDEVRARQPRGAFDARAFRELSQAVPIDPRSLRRTIRRNELRQIVPLADSTIYELERRGDFPQRFFLTPRCVVWDLAEVEAWLRSRRQPDAGKEVTKAPVPDYKLRKRNR
jgi:prophage regulatory protein